MAPNMNELGTEEVQLMSGPSADSAPAASAAWRDNRA